MDAAKLVAAQANAEAKLDGQQAVRLAIANALRDMADEIESGDRIIADIQTQEVATGSERICSAVYIRSTMKRK